MSYKTFEEVFEQWRYPAGESHLRLRSGIDEREVEVVEASARSFDDLGAIVTADRLMTRLGGSVTWFVPYFPFARHDRRTDRRDGLELAVAIDLVRPLNLVIADPHSEVAAQLPHIGQEVTVELLQAEGVFTDEHLVVIPDAGATKKALTWLHSRDHVQAAKRRDPTTGRLSGLSIEAEDLRGRPCIVIDDICDGGGTFLGLAGVLRDVGAGPLTLATTHGLFTKGAADLVERYERIACFAPDPNALPSGVDGLPFRSLYEKGIPR